jgi:hypothetical protein
MLFWMVTERGNYEHFWNSTEKFNTVCACKETYKEETDALGLKIRTSTIKMSLFSS